MTKHNDTNMNPSFRKRMYDVIFESDTASGKAFDIALLICILFSVIAVMLDSIGAIEKQYGFWLNIIEWIFTILFSIEYIFRLYCATKTWKYTKSFWGIIDLLAVLPTYLSIVIAGTHFLMVIRILRLIRVFRIFKLSEYLEQSQVLIKALKASKPKLVVFLISVVTVVTIIGSVMYLIEGEENGFTSIPRSIYWAIVTMTTVGYGDISPQTPIGQFMAALVMILGYAIIAVPTGIVSYDFVQVAQKKMSTRVCSGCGKKNNDIDAKFCKYCGTELH